MPKQTAKKTTAKNAATGTPQLYTFDIFLVSGPVSEKFLKKNPEISRTIEIRGDQTFADLHTAIFDAFNREDEHMYEFQIGGKGPNDPKAKRYVSDPDDAEATGYAGTTRIDSVKLKAGAMFGYWFDYGDDWWYQVDLVSIADDVPTGKYPNITKKVGASPPQYSDEM